VFTKRSYWRMVRNRCGVPFRFIFALPKVTPFYKLWLEIDEGADLTVRSVRRIDIFNFDVHVLGFCRAARRLDASGVEPCSGSNWNPILAFPAFKVTAVPCRSIGSRILPGLSQL
jgi:hypothetical protein